MPIQALTESMEQMITLHEALLQLSKEKTRVLVHNKMEDLNRIVHKESQLVKQIAEGERMRIEAVSRFLLMKGYKPNPHITMTELLKLVFKAEEKQKVQALQNRLVHIVGELKELNELNRQLIEQSLAFIEQSLDLVLGPPEDETVYKNPQKVGISSKRNGLFDTRA